MVLAHLFVKIVLLGQLLPEVATHVVARVAGHRARVLVCSENLVQSLWLSPMN
jgi:hypothetical protein